MGSCSHAVIDLCGDGEDELVGEPSSSHPSSSSDPLPATRKRSRPERTHEVIELSDGDDEGGAPRGDEEVEDVSGVARRLRADRIEDEAIAMALLRGSDEVLARQLQRDEERRMGGLFGPMGGLFGPYAPPPEMRDVAGGGGRGAVALGSRPPDGWGPGGHPDASDIWGRITRGHGLFSSGPLGSMGPGDGDLYGERRGAYPRGVREMAHNLANDRHPLARARELAHNLASNFAEQVAMHAAARRPGRAGQLAQLSLFDRDFGEADYELLLQLDAVDAPERKRLKQINKKLIDNLPTRRMSKAEVCGEKEPQKRAVWKRKRELSPHFVFMVSFPFGQRSFVPPSPPSLVDRCEFRSLHIS